MKNHDSPPAATSLLLLPGLMCGDAFWRPLCAALPSSVRSQTVDYGEADSLTAMAEIVLAQAPDKFALAGHSMGGRVALEVARLAPARVEKLVLMDTGFLPRAAGETGDAEKASRMALLNIARIDGVRVMCAQWVKGMVHPHRLNDTALLEAITVMFEEKNADRFARQQHALLTRPDASQVLCALQVPCLLLCGRQDSWASVAQHEAMRTLAPHASLCVIENAGHMVLMERPEETAKAIIDFLQLPVVLRSETQRMLKLISSMATRQLLTELAALWQQGSGVEVSIESVGGVDAARRVQAGEALDGVVLASDAIEKLILSGQVVAGSRVDLVRSSVAAAVKAGAARPDISTETALRSAIETAPSIGYSTGPSGTALVELFERWGIAEKLKTKIVQAPPGVPVGMLVARGEVALGFQQLSELMHLEGITVLGALPSGAGITTVFSAGVCTNSPQTGKRRHTQRRALDDLLAFMAGDEAAAVKRRHGMDPVTSDA